MHYCRSGLIQISSQMGQAGLEATKFFNSPLPFFLLPLFPYLTLLDGPYTACVSTHFPVCSKRDGTQKFGPPRAVCKSKCCRPGNNHRLSCRKLSRTFSVTLIRPNCFLFFLPLKLFSITVLYFMLRKEPMS